LKEYFKDDDKNEPKDVQKLTDAQGFQLTGSIPTGLNNLTNFEPSNERLIIAEIQPINEPHNEDATMHAQDEISNRIEQSNAEMATNEANYVEIESNSQAKKRKHKQSNSSNMWKIQVINFCKFSLEQRRLVDEFHPLTVELGRFIGDKWRALPEDQKQVRNCSRFARWFVCMRLPLTLLTLAVTVIAVKPVIAL
jgi:hypothetical protein